jgi:hypothetical protein
MGTAAAKIDRVIMPGDQFAERGTTAWADWQRSRMKHALKDVNFEARQIVQVIRDMCAGEQPAWHLMTRHEGSGFRTFEEFVTSPEGLAFPDYPKFRGMALSEPGVMNEREFDLLTKAPALTREEAGGEKGKEKNSQASQGDLFKAKRMRAIGRAPALVRRLYVGGLIDAGLAALLGPDPNKPGYAERKAKAGAALAGIQGLARSGSDREYRRAVNEAVRSAFGRNRPSALEQAKKLVGKLTAAQRRELRRWLDKQEG